MEKNVDRFVVLVSTDGKHFSSVGELLSKAPNGNSSEKLDYNFSISMVDLHDKIDFAFLLI